MVRKKNIEYFLSQHPEISEEDKEKITAALEKEKAVEKRDLIVSGSVTNILGPEMAEQFFREFDDDLRHLEIVLEGR